MTDRQLSLWPLSQTALPLLLFHQLEVSVRQDAGQSAEDPQHLRVRRDKDGSVNSGTGARELLV